MNFPKISLAALATTLMAVSPVFGQETREAGPDLIPRDSLFGNPDRAAVRLSPDGRHLSYAAPLEGVLNLWVAPIDDPAAARPVTHDTGRGVTQYFWSYDNQHLVYLQDVGGTENYNLYAVDLETGETEPLYENPEVRVMLSGVSQDHPDKILVGLNDRMPMFHDLYEIDIETGEKTLVLQHPGVIDDNMVAGFVTDDDYNVRFAAAFTPDGGLQLYENTAWKTGAASSSTGPATGPATRPAEWKAWEKVSFEDTLSTEIAGFGPDPMTLYKVDSSGRDTAALYEVDLRTGEQKLLAEDEHADVGGILAHPLKKHVQAVSFNYKQERWEVLDEAIAPDVERLRAVAGDGEWGVTSRTLDDTKWLVYTSASDSPTRYYLYERNPEAGTGELNYLFSNNTAVEELAEQGALQKMHPVVIPARDGLELVSYLTLPVGVEAKQAEGDVPVPARPVPMVLYVHGGPWARDSYGYNPIHQWLANRGYAVLSVNFRGSTGFGKEHVNAGNKEWGKKMQDDLTDAVKWAVEKGIAQEDKVAIMGGSYGGYATLAGLTMTPDLYAAGVDIVGPSNIITLLQTIPPYWAPAMTQFRTRVGDMSTEEGKKLLEAASPLNHVQNIKAPLLIGQGANDPRVKQSESDQIVEAMQEKEIPVTYVLYPDEGHGFVRPENRLSFFGVSEVFLAEHLGGRYQPLGEGDFENSSIKVPAGAGQVQGLEPALKGNEE